MELTHEQYAYIVSEFKRLLRSTKRYGIDRVIDALEKEGFFEAHCHSHDRYKGGTMNHCLWVAKFGLENLEYLHKNFPHSLKLNDYSVILVCLLHDVCDSSGFNFARRYVKKSNGKIRLLHGKRSEIILRSFKRDDNPKSSIFSNIELNAVSRHMHSRGFHNGPVSSRFSKDLKSLLHYVLKNSDGRAVEYYKDIPYGTLPLPSVPIHYLPNGLTIPIDAKEERSVSVHKMKNGLFRIPVEGEFEEVVFYITKFPEYRNSYLLAQSAADMLWRSYRINTGDGTIDIVCDIGAPTIEEARKLMKNGKFLIRIMHTNCFEEIFCKNYL